MNGAIRIGHKDDLVTAFGDLCTMLQMRHKDLAAESGLFQSQISDWLGARRSMDVTSVIRVAGALGYDLALVPKEDGPATVHTTQAEFTTELFWTQHIDPIAQAEGLERPTQINRDTGDLQQHLFKHPDGRLLLIIRTDRSDA